MSETPLARAIAAAGSASELARKIGVTAQAIYQWRQVPAERCLAVSQTTGIALHELRPDIYPDPTVALPPNPDRVPLERAGIDPRVADKVA